MTTRTRSTTKKTTPRQRSTRRSAEPKKESLSFGDKVMITVAVLLGIALIEWMWIDWLLTPVM